MDNRLLDSKARDKILEAQSWLAEYEALHHERLTGYRYQEVLLETDIAAIGAIIGLMAMTGIFSFALLLTMSLVCSCLGLLWIVQDRRCLACSDYIRGTIAPALRGLSGNPSLFGAEGRRYGEFQKESVEKVLADVLGGAGPGQGGEAPDPDESASVRPRRGLPALPRGLLINPLNIRGVILEFLFFLGPSLVGIGTGIYGLIRLGPWYWYTTVLFVAALVLTTLLAATAVRWYREGRAREPRQEPS